MDVNHDGRQKKFKYVFKISSVSYSYYNLNSVEDFL